MKISYILLFLLLFSLKGVSEMETIANRIVEYLDDDKTVWNDIDRMRMVLGVEVLIHNILMIGTILIMAWLSKIFFEAVVLLTAYGALKMSAGGVHFKKSSACLIGTGIFVWAGVWIAKRMTIDLPYIIGIYLVCLVVLALMGPQGTENNPISEDNYNILRRRTVFFVVIYLVLSVIMEKYIDVIPYLLFIAVTFETLSLLPSYVKNRSI